MDKRTYIRLRNVAIALAFISLGWMLYDQFGDREPGAMSYLDANSLFEDREYERALEYYVRANNENPDLVAALRGMTNSLVQLGRLDEALAVIDRAIEREPVFGGHYATRGIIYDHMGDYEKAMADYERSLELDPELSDGMHWIDRLLYNVQEAPPTPADRLRYLKEQFALPEDQRVLSVPELDAEQEPYEQ
jgi:tetratricopeptide (TPR) repeat protein